MSFNPFKFVYNPPASVSGDIPVHPESTTTTSTTIYNQTPGATKSASLSSQLIKAFNDLAETSAYLQEIIKLRSNNISITVDPAIDPQLAQALTTLYGSVPPGISVAMYSNLLDMDINLQLTQSSLAPGTQVNQVQAAAVSTALTSMENSLLNNVSFGAQLPIILRGLKTDAGIFNSLAKGLATYPIQQDTPASPNSAVLNIATTDVDPSLADMLNNVTNDFSTAYAGVYTLAATVSAIANDVTNVAFTMIQQPVGDIVRIVGLVNGAKGLFYKDIFSDLAKDLCNFTYLRLVADAALIVFTADKLTQIAINPFASMTGSLGQALSSIKQANASAGHVAMGSTMGGLSKANSCCPGSASASSLSISTGSSGTGSSTAASQALANEINSLSSGIKDVVSSIAWLESKVTSKISKVQSNFQKVLARRLENVTSHTNLLCSLQSAEQLVTIATSIANSNTSSSNGSGSNPISAITQSINFSQPSVFTSGPNTIITSIVGTPTPSANVQSVLKAGGLTAVGATSA